jgi:glycerate dehydrogenase
MRIVVLDGYCLNPGDLGWEALERLGTLTVHDRTAPGELLERMQDAEIVLTNKTAVPGEVISRLERLRYIGLLATGYNVVDVEAAKAKGIPVTNVPTYGTESVAQMVFAHLLNLTQHVGGHGRSVAKGKWSVCPDFCFWEKPLMELEGRTMGIVGLGHIGNAVARIATAFGMRVMAYDVKARSEGVEMVELERLFGESDVVSLHCPLTPDNERLINAKTLAMMKKTAFLINTSRGQLVDETALARALNQDKIAGAGLDVLDVEPPVPGNPLLHAKNCHITPHIAWATRAARERLMGTVVDNVKAFLQGRPQNVVNP